MPNSAKNAGGQSSPMGEWQRMGDDLTHAEFTERPDVVESPPVWWVNQGKTYDEERDGGYIWAPQRTKAGISAGHHVAVRDVRIGDRVIHYSKGHIRAVGVAESGGVEGLKPSELADEPWQVEGFTAQISYQELETPIQLNELDLEQREGVGPFTSAGGVQQGYLYPVPPR
jgi:5-methylcytosine-specific restriction enzyme B